MIKTVIIGNLTRDPELRQTTNGVNVCTLNVASNRVHDRNTADYMTVIAWRGTAENCAKYLKKGRQIAAAGDLESRTYEDRNGNKRTVWELQANEVEFLSTGQADAFAGEMTPADDEDLPF